MQSPKLNCPSCWVEVVLEVRPGPELQNSNWGHTLQWDGDHRAGKVWGKSTILMILRPKELTVPNVTDWSLPTDFAPEQLGHDLKLV